MSAERPSSKPLASARARRPQARLLAGLRPAWLAFVLLAGSCLNPSPDELPQTHGSPGSLPVTPMAQPADVPPSGSATATAAAAPAASPTFAPAPTSPPSTEGAPIDTGAAQPSDAGVSADADAPDAE